ncbi:acetyl-CoA C-acyltransferase family protein [Rhizobium sp. CFBP 8752]|uniref:acetyl-CoA C-acyltransferase family protein n=1 Tax=Rhizobium sp. CFBP 8752 TaxID=2775301 RepID=UPI00177ACC95|nr:acetyl-CoA C-acyltransferase family protein [Rhizobium sp. CFBP 8752]MBD8664234.1 acetyl-CoA C-acyltransferase family protein [Rhizobium sp. CFBP 8752]
MTCPQKQIFIVSGTRTAIGAFGGALKNHPPTELAALCTAEAVRRSGLDPAAIGHVVFGHVINTEAKDMYLARVAALKAGLPIETPAMNVNRLCGSGLQAIVSAAQAVALGDCDVAVAGGAEVMSRAPYLLPFARWGQKMGDAQTIDALTGALSDPFGHGHMGVTAENISRRRQISRQDQDEFAAESHARAARAIDEKRFASQIVSVSVKEGKTERAFDVDENVRPGTTAEKLAGLRPVFEKDGTVTAGNASSINDGAAALVLASGEAVARYGLKPMVRIIGWAHAGVEPDEMGLGPIPAVRRLLDRTGLTLDDFDVIESNEAFASQACAVARDLGLSAAKTNPNGGAIALGHPVGASGAIITVKAIYELVRVSARRALVTMCIGGGQGIAVAVERVS